MIADLVLTSTERLLTSCGSTQDDRVNQHSIGNVVAIDDDMMTLRALQGHATRYGYSLKSADTAASGLQLINDTTSVALVDLRLPDIDGFECLRYVRESYPHVQIIVLTGSNETSDAVEAMRAGAFQFVTKPFDPKQLLVYLAKACETSATKVENRDLRESHCHNLPVQVPLVSGDANSRLMNQIKRLAAVDSTVFIGGESGTGKSTVARMIHQNSSRAKGPFVSINCASLPRDLLTSELFGHTKGSFTGAVKDRAGHAEVADGGTLFLDEIGDLPLELQPKLLTFLQDRTVQRLGSSEVRRVDVRLIVATHCDLAAMCREQAFRPDLYFRLMVLSVDLPPLRERMAELPAMAEGILAKICERMGTAPKQITDGAMRVLFDHSWPGNIRELENVLERAVAFSTETKIHARDLVVTNVALDRRGRGGEQVAIVASSDLAVPTTLPQVRHEPELTSKPLDRFAQTLTAGRSPSPQITDSSSQLQSDEATASFQLSVEKSPPNNSVRYVLVGKTLADIERDAIIQTLEACRGNKAKTARMLGISEKSIYNKMRRLDIEQICHAETLQVDN